MFISRFTHPCCGLYTTQIQCTQAVYHTETSNWVGTMARALKPMRAAAKLLVANTAGPDLRAPARGVRH